MKPITGQVRCSGKKHRISITPGGPVIIHNHSRAELAADRIMTAPSGDPCRCSQVLRAWRAKDRAKIPVWARQLFDDSQQLSERRYRAQNAKKRDPLTKKMIPRIHARLEDLVEAMIHSCGYQICETINLPVWVNRHINPSSTYRPYMCRAYSGIEIALNTFRWHNHIYKRGLAVISGCFVLDILSEDEHGYTVLAGRQNGSQSIDTIRARVIIDATGAKTLQWLDDRKNVNILGTITGNVRCSGKMHRISITPDGPVTLHDHTRADLAAERIMIALGGGDPCRCSQVLQSWRDRIPAGLPAWARSEFDNSLKKYQRRGHARTWGKDPFYTPILQRVLIKLRGLISASMKHCNYRMKELNSGCYAQHARGKSQESGRIYGVGNDISIYLNLPRWYRLVYKRGLAVVDGKFVLGVVSEDATGYIVLAGRQNADLSFNTVRAHITADATGAKTLQWLDTPEGC